MNLFLKIFLFIVIFSLLFFGVRMSNIINLKILISDVSSVPWLYSTIGLIFGITSAFIIQSEWNNWDNLVNSVLFLNIFTYFPFSFYRSKKYSLGLHFYIKYHCFGISYS